MWTCCFAHVGPGLFHLILGTDLRCPVTLDPSPVTSPSASSKQLRTQTLCPCTPVSPYPCIPALPVARGCLALPGHLHILPSFKFCCCGHLACLMSFLITFSFSCPRAQISEADLSGFSVLVGKKTSSSGTQEQLKNMGREVKLLCLGKNTDAYLPLDALVSRSTQSGAENEHWLNTRFVKLNNWVNYCFFWPLWQFDKIPVWALLNQLSPVLDFGRGACGNTCMCSAQRAARVTAAISWRCWKCKNPVFSNHILDELVQDCNWRSKG